MDTIVTKQMVDAGIDANLLNRGKDVDSGELVKEIYRAMELARQEPRAVRLDEHQDRQYQKQFSLNR